MKLKIITVTLSYLRSSPHASNSYSEVKKAKANKSVMNSAMQEQSNGATDGQEHCDGASDGEDLPDLKPLKTSKQGENVGGLSVSLTSRQNSRRELRWRK